MATGKIAPRAALLKLEVEKKAVREAANKLIQNDYKTQRNVGQYSLRRLGWRA